MKLSKFIVPFLLLFFSNNFYGQITKHNWMVGGNGSFSSEKKKYPSNETLNAVDTRVSIAPSIAYFFVDKLATGVRMDYEYYETKISYYNYKSSASSFSIGPMIRYYFLPPENRVNILSEIGYKYFVSGYSGATYEKTKINTYSFSAGPVVYFNSCVGLEFTLNYTKTKFINNDQNSGMLGLGIGLQVHLKK